jgi:hypothetical protein
MKDETITLLQCGDCVLDRSEEEIWNLAVQSKGSIPFHLPKDNLLIYGHSIKQT